MLFVSEAFIVLYNMGVVERLEYLDFIIESSLGFFTAVY